MILGSTFCDNVRNRKLLEKIVKLKILLPFPWAQLLRKNTTMVIEFMEKFYDGSNTGDKASVNFHSLKFDSLLTRRTRRD